MNRLYTTLLLTMVFALTGYPAQAEQGNPAIQKGSQVAFDYTLIVDAKEVDSSKERGPLQYTHGDGKIIPGLSRRLEGLHAGDEERIEVSPEEAYGQVNPSAFQEIPRSQLPANLEPQVGMILRGRSPQGQVIPAKITEVKEDNVVLDLNHPLAGKTLTFQVKIVSVE